MTVVLGSASGAALSSVLREPSERPEVVEKFREEGWPESGDVAPFWSAPLGILGGGLASSLRGSVSMGSTSSTDSNT